MERGSLERLKFDTRLRLRQGWVSQQDTQNHIDSLPDASDKIAAPAEEQEELQATDEPAAPAEELGDGPVDPLSPPPFKEV